MKGLLQVPTSIGGKNQRIIKMGDNYIHPIQYFSYDDKIVGILPSMDKAFLMKSSLDLPESIVSEEKPIFHKSYKRKDRIKRVFVLTNACNLQCSYCFEGTHNINKVMKPEMVENGIKQMFSEAKQLNKKLISISLFGGEPSMNWEAVEKAISTAKMLEHETGIRCYKAIVTNGVMDTSRVIYLADNMDFIYFSFDGPRDLFLKQRKPKGGNDVYETIFNNAQEVYKRGTYLSFKITVTKHTINSLKEIDDYFSYHFPTCGRLYQPCMVDQDDELYISFGEFLEKYLELKRYTIFAKNMSTSLYKNKPSDRFCNLMVRNVIYPDGNVLTCHRSNMCIPDDAVEREFKVGFCNQDGRITRLPDCQKYMETFVVDSIPDCKECPLKYHCCGGCATIKLLSGNHDMFRKADYCENFLRYAWTELLSRLLDAELNMIGSLPERIESPKGDVIKDIKFFDEYVEKCIEIEE